MEPISLWPQHALVASASLVVTALAVVVHYEGLRWLSIHILPSSPPTAGLHDRRSMLLLIFTVLCLHITEIWLYGIGFWVLLMMPGTGTVHGADQVDSLLDAVYLSTSTYSTVGFGDLAPVGAIRFMAGMEALTGVVLAAWSASFTFLEMSRHWNRKESK